MGSNQLISIIKFPVKIYNDLHVLLRAKSIRNGKAPWLNMNLFEIIWVHPDEIIGSLHRKDRLPAKLRGHTISGDWDREYKKIEETTAFKVIDLRYRKGLSWEEIFQKHAEPHGFLTEKQILKYREKIPLREAVYKDLKESGWKTSMNKKKSLLFCDELTVNVTRDGRLLRNNSGMHRLVMARLLGLQRIPCLLHVVHSDYFRTSMNGDGQPVKKVETTKAMGKDVEATV